MAADISAPLVPEGDAPPSLANGDHAPDTSDAVAVADAGTPLPAKETTTITPIKDAAPDPNPAGPTPTEDVSSGMQPVADFIPKEAPTLSHPTPPPEETLITSEANVDTDMPDAEERVKQQPSVAEPAADPAASPEQGLVRPREEEGEEDEEPAAKRSRVDEPPAAETGHAEATTAADDAPAGAPKAEPVEPASAPSEVPAAAPAAPASSEQPAEAEVKPSVEEAAAAPATPQKESAPAPEKKYSTAPITPLQKSVLSDKMKNLKKTKHSHSFLKPVDPVALNIPSYPEIVKNPMDLGTMDAKLKANQYQSVQDFADDFDLIVSNCRKFNGDQHPVTASAFNMQAYFNRMMESIPSPDQAPPAKAPKRASPAVKTHPRREPRAAAAAATTTAAATAAAPTAAAAPPPPADSQTFALQADGVPQIRRESGGGVKDRPARTIRPPQNREIPYAKPKRKEHQLELRFCEHVLDELKSTNLWSINNVFLAPVDPVALNIPNYFSVIKNPMDLATMTQKLKLGQYGKASEFKKDFDLMIDNCLIFNPQGNPVRDMGIQLRRHFESLWRDKEKWEKQNRPESARATSASADEDSEGEDEEDDAPDDEKEIKIKALQEQLAQMQNMIADLGGDPKGSKTKKAKSKGGDKKKVGSTSAVPKSKAPAAKSKKAAKPKQVTYEEKQEISEAVGRMNDHQVAELTKIITENCAKYRDMDEMELEIDDLPNDVQALLLKYVRRLFGRPKTTAAAAAAADSPPDDGAAEDDEEYLGDRGGRGGGSKRKKHKPMGKREQAEQIANLQDKLSQFQKVTSGSESPNAYNHTHPRAASSDDESEESEEE